MPSNDTTGWLIETGANPPTYWSGRRVDEFVTDSNDALRFARFVDAERVRCWLLERHGGVFCKSTEHLWMAPHREQE